VVGKVLLVGETWVTHAYHQKGFMAFDTGFYATGATPLIAALESAGWEVQHIPNHLAATTFPTSLDELANVAVVILSDIPADTLLLHPDTFERGQRTPNRLDLLRHWASDGHGLLMVGGYMSFAGFQGKARYGATPINDCLPVEVSRCDDRVECPQGILPTLVAGHEILRGLPADWPHFLGYNQLRPKRGAEILLTIGDDPLLAVWEFGSGRVAAFASDCSPHWGSPEFLAWPAYGQFWEQLVTWLAAPALRLTQRAGKEGRKGWLNPHAHG